MPKFVFRLPAAVIAVVLFVLVLAPSAGAQETVYDVAWLRSVATQPNPIDKVMQVWMIRKSQGWALEAPGNTTIGIPANAVVLAADMTSGNMPSFEQITAGIWYTAAGGQFGSTGLVRAFELDGDPVLVNALNVDSMLAAVKAETEYGKKIELLDIEWSAGKSVINRWGSSGPVEVLTGAQITALEAAGLPLQAVTIDLPGNTLVWGELAPGEHHYGIVAVPGVANLYATTCLGGRFATLRGYRAMQFAPFAENAVISDTTGCNGAYPVLNPENPISVMPLATGG